MLVGKPIRKFVGKNVRIIVRERDNGISIGYTGKLMRESYGKYQVVSSSVNDGYCFFHAKRVKSIGTKQDAIGNVRQVFLYPVKLEKIA